MRLLVTTPTSVAVEADDVRYLRAEDDTGAFGILPGHGDLIAVLPISVITWRDAAAGEHHVAVRGGVLTVRDGSLVQVATRQAVAEDSLERLGRAVLERFRDELEAEETAWVSAQRLQVAALRRLQRYLDAGHRPAAFLPPRPGTRPRRSEGAGA